LDYRNEFNITKENLLNHVIPLGEDVFLADQLANVRIVGTPFCQLTLPGHLPKVLKTLITKYLTVTFKCCVRPPSDIDLEDYGFPHRREVLLQLSDGRIYHLESPTPDAKWIQPCKELIASMPESIFLDKLTPSLNIEARLNAYCERRATRPAIFQNNGTNSSDSSQISNSQTMGEESGNEIAITNWCGESYLSTV
jgi:hypothetical protein